MLVPILEFQHAPLTQDVLQAKEHALIPSIVFTLGHIRIFQGVGGA